MGEAGAPLLRHAPSTSLVEQTALRACPYTCPHRVYSCTSPLSTLITHHHRLIDSRRCSDMADVWNSRPNLVFEHGDRRFVNDVANAGAALNMAKNEDTVFYNLFKVSYG